MEQAKLTEILAKARKCKVLLTDFEWSLIMDRSEAVKKYGTRAIITPKQEKVLEEIAIKLGIY